MKSRDSISALDSVTARIQQFILEEKLPPGYQMPSGRALATNWKTDFSTVNRAIHELTVRGILRRVGYKLFLQRLPGVPLPPVHVIGPDASTFRGAEEISALYGTYTITSEWEWHAYRAKVRSLLDPKSKCGGLILWCGSTATPVDDLLVKFSCPVVTLAKRFPHCSSVEMDCERAAEMAVNHLESLKHKTIACVSWKDLPWHAAFMDGYSRACAKSGLSASAERVFSIERTKPAMRRAVASFCSTEPQITAVILNDITLGDYLLDALKDNLAVPGALSVVVYGDPDEAAKSEPPMTTVTQDTYQMGKLAATILYGQKLRAAKTGLSQKPEHVRLDPQLIVRSSTRALESHEAPAVTEAKNRARWPSSLEERKALVEKNWETPHPRLEQIPPDRFFPLDIRPYAKRALNRFNSWIGFVPLIMPKIGRQKIHGVVFDILSTKAKNRHTAIVMRSRHAQAANLEAEVCVAVGSRAEAVYFLQGCGWVVDHARIGAYRFEYTDGTSLVLPLVAHGDDPSDPAFKEQWCLESNIQDWWQNFPQFNNAQVRNLVIAQNGDPEVSERYLYTLEWVNPYPEKIISSIRITSQPDSEATLGVLAISLLLPVAVQDSH